MPVRQTGTGSPFPNLLTGPEPVRRDTDNPGGQRRSKLRLRRRACELCAPRLRLDTAGLVAKTRQFILCLVELTLRVVQCLFGLFQLLGERSFSAEYDVNDAADLVG